MEALTHLVLVWGAIYIAFFLARKMRVTPVLWYLAIGSLMVNVGLLPIEPDPFIRGLGEVGIVMIMFALGFEEQTDNFIESIKKSRGIAFFGAVAPFIAAYSVALCVFEDRNIALMSGLTMTATAVSLTIASLRSEGLQRSATAIRIMTLAVLDDIASLALSTGARPWPGFEPCRQAVGLSRIDCCIELCQASKGTFRRCLMAAEAERVPGA